MSNELNVDGDALNREQLIDILGLRDILLIPSSTQSRQTVFVRFLNCTFKEVDLFWVDFEGGLVRYARLQPKQYFDVTTYRGHHWIFRLPCNGSAAFCLRDRGRIEEVFTASSANLRLRICVPVVLKLKSLLKTAALCVAELCGTSERAKRLQLPESLQFSLSGDCIGLHRSQSLIPYVYCATLNLCHLIRIKKMITTKEQIEMTLSAEDSSLPEVVQEALKTRQLNVVLECIAELSAKDANNFHLNSALLDELKKEFALIGEKTLYAYVAEWISNLKDVPYSQKTLRSNCLLIERAVRSVNLLQAEALRTMLNTELPPLHNQLLNSGEQNGAAAICRSLYCVTIMEATYACGVDSEALKRSWSIILQNKASQKSPIVLLCSLLISTQMRLDAETKRYLKALIKRMESFGESTEVDCDPLYCDRMQFFALLLNNIGRIYAAAGKKVSHCVLLMESLIRFYSDHSLLDVLSASIYESLHLPNPNSALLCEHFFYCVLLLFPKLIRESVQESQLEKCRMKYLYDSLLLPNATSKMLCRELFCRITELYPNLSSRPVQEETKQKSKVELLENVNNRTRSLKNGDQISDTAKSVAEKKPGHSNTVVEFGVWLARIGGVLNGSDENGKSTEAVEQSISNQDSIVRATSFLVKLLTLALFRDVLKAYPVILTPKICSESPETMWMEIMCDYCEHLAHQNDLIQYNSAELSQALDILIDGKWPLASMSLQTGLTLFGALMQLLIVCTDHLSERILEAIQRILKLNEAYYCGILKKCDLKLRKIFEMIAKRLGQKNCTNRMQTLIVFYLCASETTELFVEKCRDHLNMLSWKSDDSEYGRLRSIVLNCLSIAYKRMSNSKLFTDENSSSVGKRFLKEHVLPLFKEQFHAIASNNFEVIPHGDFEIFAISLKTLRDLQEIESSEIFELNVNGEIDSATQICKSICGRSKKLARLKEICQTGDSLIVSSIVDLLTAQNQRSCLLKWKCLTSFISYGRHDLVEQIMADAGLDEIRKMLQTINDTLEGIGSDKHKYDGSDILAVCCIVCELQNDKKKHLVLDIYDPIVQWMLATVEQNPIICLKLIRFLFAESLHHCCSTITDDQCALFAQLFIRCVQSTQRYADSESHSDSLLIRNVHLVSSIAHALIPLKTSFARIAPFMISECLAGAKHTPLVIRYLLAICDRYSIAVLSTNLPSAQKWQFKQVYTNYRKTSAMIV
ncbi:unnamed protein product [Anisakis simplex]|uniref:VHL domain-containing protein n=1 Tax=Anisakis simplex TaxID=6269 RepID=A0A0M3JRP7_ANISI|nr:unnamed protein product [Anisakis simplex]